MLTFVTRGRKSYSVLLAAMLVGVLHGCGNGGGGDGGGGGGGSAGVTSIEITPATLEMLEGGSRKLQASGTWSDGSTTDISSYTNLAWNTSNPSVVTMSGQTVTANGAGTATISASMDGRTATATVTVQPVTNKTILYIATSADTSSYFSGYNISVQSSSQTLIRYVPEDNLADLVDQNSSYSYAPSTIYPYTVDDRFFIRREVRPNEYIGSHSITEFNPRTGQQVLSVTVSDPNSISSGCAAIMGSTYYYREARNWDYLYGYTGGDFKRFSLYDGAYGSGSYLFGYADADTCKLNLQASNGVLFDASYFDYNSAKYLEIYKRDATTGRINAAATKSWTVSDAANYGTTVQFAFSDGKAYWARRRLSDGQVEIWSSDFVATNPSPVYAGVIPGISNINYFSASHGHLALGDASGTIFILDTGTNANTTISVGLSFYALQVLYLGP